MKSRGATWTESDVVCHWCHGPAIRSPYRTPVEGVPAARWVVCSPDCPNRPTDAITFTARLTAAILPASERRRTR